MVLHRPIESTAFTGHVDYICGGVSAIRGAVNVYRAQGDSPTVLFHCNDDQREVILKATVAEADHLFLNRGEQFGGA